MNKTLVDLLERTGWTFVQALAGSAAAGGTAASLGTFDWRAALVGAAVAAVLAALKVLGVRASTVVAVAKMPVVTNLVADVGKSVPSITAVVKDVEVAASQPAQGTPPTASTPTAP